VHNLDAQNFNGQSQNETDGLHAEVSHHPLYSPDLAPSNFHLFLYLKKHLTGKKFDNDDEVQEEVMTWFKGQAADFYDNASDYVEK
jgi:histone-lysine N-methyltransferase SETMAR